MARAKPVPELVFAGPSGAALSSAVCPFFRVAAAFESAGLLVLTLNIATMLARCISAWPNVGANRRPKAVRLSEGLCGEDTWYERGVGHEPNPAHTSAARNCLSANVYGCFGSTLGTWRCLKIRVRCGARELPLRRQSRGHLAEPC